LLTKRGNLFANGKLDKVEVVDRAINNLVNMYTEDLTVPVMAYITFQTEEGLSRCDKFMF